MILVVGDGPRNAERRPAQLPAKAPYARKTLSEASWRCSRFPSSASASLVTYPITASPRHPCRPRIPKALRRWMSGVLEEVARTWELL